MAQRLEQTWFSIHRPEDQLHGACCGPRPVRFCNLESWSWFDSIGLSKVLDYARAYFCVCSNKLAVSLWHHPSIHNHQHSVFSCVFKPYPSTMCSWEITLIIKHSLQPAQLKMNSFLQRWFEVKSENLQISLSRSVASASLWLPQAKSCACVQSVLVWNDLIYLVEFTQLIYWIMCSLVHSNIKIVYHVYNCILKIFSVEQIFLSCLSVKKKSLGFTLFFFFI